MPLPQKSMPTTDLCMRTTGLRESCTIHYDEVELIDDQEFLVEIAVII